MVLVDQSNRMHKFICKTNRKYLKENNKGDVWLKQRCDNLIG